MTALILTARFGLGHFSVANTLAAEAKEKYGCDSTRVVDFFEYAMPNHSQELYKSYKLLVNRGSGIYNLYYKTSDRDNRKNRVPFLHYFMKALYKLLGETRPAVVLSTLPFCSQLLSAFKEQTGSELPLITCITDISTHIEWINPHTDLYLVASQSLKSQLVGRGVEPARICIYGIPVKERFKCIPPRNGGAAEKHLLIMGGGMGLLPRKRQFYDQLDRLPGVKTVIITGHNTEAYSKLHGQYRNIEVVGFTGEVAKYMEWCDLIVSKPGGITLFEAIQAARPIVVIHPFLQQEIGNANFIINHNIGRVFWRGGPEIPQDICSLLHDEKAIGTMRRNMVLLKSALDDTLLKDAMSSCMREQKVRAS